MNYFGLLVINNEMDLKCTTSQKRTYLIGFVKETGETEEVFQSKYCTDFNERGEWVSYP